MKKIDVQDLIQLLGMVGIIGSLLIFVGLERGNHNVLQLWRKIRLVSLR